MNPEPFHSKGLNVKLTGLLALCLVLLTAACTGLGGEPQIVATRVIPTSAPATPIVDRGVPASVPDLASGARIFAARCAECHGIDGGGQGELVLSGQVPAMTSFLDPATARGQTPHDFFDTITNGRLENLMPPWRNALSEQERWDVALYAYTLHYTRDMLDTGQAIYQECAECHGETGRGDGHEAVRTGARVPDLTDFEAMVTLGDQSMFNMISEGALDDMPAYADVLTPDEIFAVAAYARTFSVANADTAAEPVATAEVTGDGTSADAAPTDAPSTDARPVTVSGRVSNRSAGGEVPAGLVVTLRTFDPLTMTPLADRDRTAVITADGTFDFGDVPMEQGRVVIAAVNYNDRNFASGFVEPPAPDAAPVLDLPIELYELTDDPSVVTIRGGVTRLRVVGDSVEVQQLYQFINTSDRLYTSLERGTDGQYSAVEIALPPGAVVLGFDDERAYTIADDGSRVYDMRPLLPNEQRLTVVSYLLEYTGALEVEYPLYYALDGQVRFLLQPESVTLTSDDLPFMAQETVGGEAYQVYGAVLQRDAGTLMRYALSGEGLQAAVGVEQGGQVVSAETLPLIFGVVAAVLGLGLLLAWWLMRRRPAQSDEGDTPDSEIARLAREIAALDEQHEKGEINHDLWHAERNHRRARMAELMRPRDDSGDAR
jgi:mono/diheme cytochrome c family protein